MNDSSRKKSNCPIDQMIGNMTSDVHNSNGQFVQLGFTPPATPVDNVPWTMQNQVQECSFIPHYSNSDTELKISYPQYSNQDTFSYVQQQHLFNDPETYGYNNCYQNTPSNMDMIFPERKVLILQNHEAQQSLDCVPNLFEVQTNRTQLIENLAGHWAVPNNTGTYSPFGSAQFVPNIGIFEPRTSVEVPNCNSAPQMLECGVNLRNEDVSFQFIRDSRKPVAEVKPMRPTYSDVLTKTPPQSVVKSSKVDGKEVKQKKDSNKKGMKSVKIGKPNGILSRCNTNGDIKDLPNDKSTQCKSTERSTKTSKTNQLNRKWASLDNIAETFDDLKESLPKIKKHEDILNSNNGEIKNNRKKSSCKSSTDFGDTDSGNSKTESSVLNKNSTRKCFFRASRQKICDSFNSNDRPSGKRGQRNKKRDCHVPFGVAGQKLKQYLDRWWKLFVYFILWLIHLICDICSLSVHLSHDVVRVSWEWLLEHWAVFCKTWVIFSRKFHCLTWLWDKLRRKKRTEETNRSFPQTSLQYNINMPMTGDEAMKRLLACKGKDPYSILGVVPTCTDDDIKRYYKRQAFLVHPDKNNQPGAEEAFKILVHAFDMIGEPERRMAYDRGVAESAQVEQAWSELTELLAQLQQKVEAAANTIRCSSCNLRHKRIKVDRPSYAARNCTSCKIHHAAREGDIWAEAKCFGFLWHYYACMEGGVYDITEWAGCQKGSLKHLKPDSHHVQYRIALGKQNGNGRRQSASPRNERPPDLENLLNSLYGQTDNLQQHNSKRKNKKK